MSCATSFRNTRSETVEADGDEYEADIERILNAFGTQHRDQRDKLIAGLKEARLRDVR